MLAPGGWLALQVPGNFTEPAHVLLRELAESDRWRPRLEVVWPSVHEPPTYLGALLDLGLEPDVWTTTYLHRLAGDDAVLEWLRGTALRPVLAALSDDECAAFVDEYRELLRPAYPRMT